VQVPTIDTVRDNFISGEVDSVKAIANIPRLLGNITVAAGESSKPVSWKPNILLVRDDKLNEVERIICPWPAHRESGDGRHACTVLDRAARPRLKEILAVYSSGKDDKRNVFVFPAAEVSNFNLCRNAFFILNPCL
jgi:hypothetical protein